MRVGSWLYWESWISITHVVSIIWVLGSWIQYHPLASHIVMLLASQITQPPVTPPLYPQFPKSRSQAQTPITAKITTTVQDHRLIHRPRSKVQDMVSSTDHNPRSRPRATVQDTATIHGPNYSPRSRP
jgi:hypothetical protein